MVKRRVERWTITHITDEYIAGGGVPAVIADLSRNMAALGASNKIVCGDSELSPPDGAELRTYSVSRWGRPWAWSPSLIPLLRNALATGARSIAHVHGVWMAPNLLGARVAEQFGVPLVLSSHGMLSPYLWRYKGDLARLRKTLYWRVFAAPIFQKAAIVHAITDIESRHLRALLPRASIQTIPNGIDIERVDRVIDSFGSRSIADSPRTILFVGRIDPVKGIDLLINAFAQAALPKTYGLTIAGFDRTARYSAFLRGIAIEQGVADRVNFVGPLVGAAKLEAYCRAWVVAVPSHSEVVGMVNLEASACRTPTITTFETGLSDWQDGGGLLVRPNIASLVDALSTAAGWSYSERLERGRLARQLVEQRYAWSKLRLRWRDLYWSL